MKKQREDILLPLDVSGVYSVLKNPHCLKGFRVTVKYDGCANLGKRFLRQSNVLPAERGCSFGKAVYADGQTSVDYIFHDGLFLSDAMKRASDFNKDVHAIVGLRPVDVSSVYPCFFSLLSGKWSYSATDDDSVCMGYKIIVRYPGNMTNNRLFKYVIEQRECQIVNVKYDKNVGMTDVEYYTRNKNSDSYHKASMFQSVMFCRIKSDNNENIK